MGAFTTEELMDMYKKHKSAEADLVQVDNHNEDVSIYLPDITLPVCEPPPGFEFEDR